MIEINLVPGEVRKSRRKIDLPEIPIIPVLAALIGCFVALQVILGGAIIMCKRQLSGLDKTWQDLAPKKAQFDSIKHEIKGTNTKVRAIEALIEKRLSWSRILNELSNSMVAGIWLNALTYQEKAGKTALKTRVLTLSGSASAGGEEATRDVARFIKALKANKNFFENFSDVELVSIKKGGSREERELMNFTLVCRFKPGKGGGGNAAGI
jgi:Tfp pilus assembly protein PilN